MNAPLVFQTYDPTPWHDRGIFAYGRALAVVDPEVEGVPISTQTNTQEGAGVVPGCEASKALVSGPSNQQDGAGAGALEPAPAWRLDLARALSVLSVAVLFVGGLFSRAGLWLRRAALVLHLRRGGR